MKRDLNELVEAARGVLLDVGSDFEGRSILEDLVELFENPDGVQSVTFKELLGHQYNLQNMMGWPEGGPGLEGFKNSMLALVVEATEALNETPWKPWKTSGYKDIDVKSLATEMTDILQFWANAALHMGLSPEYLSKCLRQKWTENIRRIHAGEVVSVKNWEKIK